MDLQNIKKLIVIYSNERAFVRQEIIPKKQALGRRVLTHLVFAHCEAIAYYVKGSVNIDYEKKEWEGAIETDHWFASMDDEYVIDDDGGFFERERRTKTLPHLLFVLKYASKYLGKTLDPKQVAGWQHVKPAFKVRDRITHPKFISALSITDEDLKHIEALEQWLDSCLAVLTENA